MNLWQTYLYLGVFLLSVLITTGIALYAWQQRQVASATAFARLLACGSVVMWSSFLLEIVPLEFSWIAQTYSLRMFGLIPVPLAWLCFALDYSGRSHWLTRSRIWALGSFTGLNFLIYASNPLHQWFYTALAFDRSGLMTVVQMTVVQMTDGPWFYVYALYGYILILSGTVLLIQFALSTSRLYRSQALLLVLGACGALLPITLTTLGITQVSYLPIGMLVMAVLYGQAIFRYRLLNLAPVARHTLVDSMSDCMLVVDTQERIVDLNPAMAAFLGVGNRSVIGHLVWDYVPRTAEWEAWLREPSGAQSTLTFARPDGTRTYDLRISPLHNRWGQCSGQMAVLRDITERQHAAEVLQNYAQELEARNAELDAFAHTVAHDLKNPLSAVVGFATLLVARHNKVDEAQQLMMFNTISRQGYRMTRIIDELLLLASLRKLGDVAFTPLDMGQIVAEVQERLAAALEEKQAHLTLPETWPVPLGYAAWVEEILANYLSNALKYGGTPPHIVLGWDVQGADLRFWVQDDGAGLTLEEQSRLFSPFTRLDQVSASGHGLGLSIVHRISQKLGGQVGVSSAPGQGSTFWFTLAAAAPVQEEVEALERT